MLTAPHGDVGGCVSTTDQDESWFAIQVVPQHERKVASLLEYKSYQSFLPVYKSRRRWCDRVKMVERPVFPGYVFCRSKLNSIGKLWRSPGVIRVVSFGAKPCPIPDAEIKALQRMTASERDICIFPYLTIGEKVRITGGPLSGVTGIITHFKRHSRLVISVDLIMRSVSIEIDGSEVQLAAPLAAA
jgi:transcription termination/antitermination protein NusG